MILETYYQIISNRVLYQPFPPLAVLIKKKNPVDFFKAENII